MGEISRYMSEYLSLARYSSDFWNGTLYKGKRRIKVWQLGKYRKGVFAPVRTIQLFCRGKKNIILEVDCLEKNNAEIPKSIMKRKSGNIPIRTLLLYCGEDNFDGMERMRSLFQEAGLQGDYGRLMQEYRIGVFCLQDLQEENYETGFREIVGVFKRRDSEEALLTYYMENKERFQMLDEVSVNLMGALIGIRGLKNYKQDKGGVDMCKAFAQAAENARRKGLEEGRKEGRREGSFQALCCLVEKGKLKLKDAAEEVGMTEEMFLERMKLAMDMR